MTVEELVRRLNEMPPDALVYRAGGKRHNDEIPVEVVEYNDRPGWGVPANTIRIV